MTTKKLLSLLLSLAMCVSLFSTAAFAADSTATAPNGNFVFSESVESLTVSESDRSFYFTFDFDETVTNWMTFNLKVSGGTGDATISANQSTNQGDVYLTTTNSKAQYQPVTWSTTEVQGAYAAATTSTYTLKQIDGFDLNLPANAYGDFKITLEVTEWGYYTNYATDTTSTEKTHYVVKGGESKTYTTTVSVTNPNASPYTVAISAPEGVTEVAVGETVEMTVTATASGTATLDNMAATVTYDTTAFSYAADAEKTGKIELSAFGAQNNTYTTTLTFTALAAKDAAKFDFEIATAHSEEDAPNGDSEAAATASCTLKVVEKTYTIAQGAVTGGTIVSIDKAIAKAGETVTVTAAVAAGYKLPVTVTVTPESGAPITAAAGAVEGTYTFTMPASNVTVTAAFTEKVKSDVTVTYDAAKGSASANMSNDVMEGETVTVTVAPNEGCMLGNITAGGVVLNKISDTVYTFTMPAEDVTVIVTFEDIPEDEFDVIVDNTNTNVESITGAPAKATAGTEITLTVTPEDGYEVIGVTVTGATSGDPVAVTENVDGTYTFSMPTEGVEVAVVTVGLTLRADYVNGYTLVLVTGDAANGYTCNGNNMYWSMKYNAYAYLVSGTGEDAVIAEGTTKGATIPSGYNVNGHNTQTEYVDFNDAGAANGCANLAYDVAANMELYLRADVNGDKTVTAADVNAIMGSDDYKIVHT